MIGEADHALRRLREWAAGLPGPGSDLRGDPIKDLMIVIDATVANHIHERGFDPVRVGRAIQGSGSHEEAPEAAPGPQAPEPYSVGWKNHRQRVVVDGVQVDEPNCARCDQPWPCEVAQAFDAGYQRGLEQDPSAEIARLRKIIVDWWNDPDNPPVEAVRIVNEEREHVHGPECSDEPEARRRPGKIVPVPDPMEILTRIQDALAGVGITGYSSLLLDEGVKSLTHLYRQTHSQLLTAQASTQQHLEASSHRAQIAEHYRTALQRIANGDRASSTVWSREEAQAALAAPEWDKRIRP